MYRLVTITLEHVDPFVETTVREIKKNTFMTNERIQVDMLRTLPFDAFH